MTDPKRQLIFIKKTKQDILKFFKEHRSITIPLFLVYISQIEIFIDNLYKCGFFDYAEDYENICDFINILKRWSK
jgi:hypothetical protein